MIKSICTGFSFVSLSCSLLYLIPAGTPSLINLKRHPYQYLIHYSILTLSITLYRYQALLRWNEILKEHMQLSTFIHVCICTHICILYLTHVSVCMTRWSHSLQVECISPKFLSAQCIASFTTLIKCHSLQISFLVNLIYIGTWDLRRGLNLAS